MTVEPATGEAARAPLVGAAATAGRPEVFALRDVNPTTGASTFVCSATLIGQRTLITAAHCLEEMGRVRVLVAHDVPLDADATAADLFAVVETRRHPLYDARAEHDLALLWLDRAPAAPRALFNLRSIDSLQGASAQAVGYGTNVTSEAPVEPPQLPLGSGVKREVSLPMRTVRPFAIEVGDQSARGICQGDSGGPLLLSFADRVERVVGVHATTSNLACTDGTDARVDGNLDFVVPWFIEHERPTCAEDALCAAGCPAPDPDCRGDGVGCLADVQCEGGRCVSDVQHPAPYCSRACAADPDCSGALGCREGLCQKPLQTERQPGDACQPGEFCLGGTVCAGDGALFCVRPCTRDAECLRLERCQVDLTGQHFCQRAPAIIIDGPLSQLPAATGCSASGLQAFALLSLASLFRYRSVGRR